MTSCSAARPLFQDGVYDASDRPAVTEETALPRLVAVPHGSRSLPPSATDWMMMLLSCFGSRPAHLLYRRNIVEQDAIDLLPGPQARNEALSLAVVAPSRLPPESYANG
jgi:hypothetical protein